jgi:N-acetylglucosamine kinase-like BadF-type ATPase
MPLKDEEYVIGVDGGGTRTIAALASFNGRILEMAKAGPASPRNVGIEKAAGNIAIAVKKLLAKHPKIKITSVFIGLPAIEEEFKFKTRQIQKKLLRRERILRNLKEKISIGSDQSAAFRSGTDEKDGILLIAGTGCAGHGWKKKKECKISGWGWLADEGAAFWIGQKVIQAALKDLDGRGSRTLLTDFAFRKFGIKKHDPDLLNKKIYSPNFIEIVSSLSFVCDSVAKKGDKTARIILSEAGKELALTVKTIIGKLNFSKTKFPLVLVGGVLKSKIVSDVLKKEIKKAAPKVQFVQIQKEPVAGAIKLAIEMAKK